MKIFLEKIRTSEKGIVSKQIWVVMAFVSFFMQIKRTDGFHLISQQEHRCSKPVWGNTWAGFFVENMETLFYNKEIEKQEIM